jgi:hypothetical protein
MLAISPRSAKPRSKPWTRTTPRKWRVLQDKGIHFGRGPAGKVAFLFPGQGSQYVNMLADVPDPIVRETFAEADRTMGPILGRPLTSYVYKNADDKAAMEDAEEALKDTTICQPAMVATDIAIMRMLGKHGVFPDMVMGHSLGEWAAAVGARMINFSEALVAVSARARAMASVSIGDKGKMASVLGPTDEIVRRLPEIGGYLTPANMNSKKQTVIAGASDAVDRAVDYFNNLGMTAQIIPGVARLPQQSGRARRGCPVPDHLRDADRSAQHSAGSATSTDSSIPRAIWKPSSGAWPTRWRRRSSSSRASKPATARARASSSRSVPSAPCRRWPRAILEDKTRRPLPFHQPPQARRRALVPRCHVWPLRRGHSAPRAIGPNP